MVEQMLEQRDILVLLVMPVAEGLAHRVGSDLTQPDFLRRLVQYFISPVPFNRLVFTFPAPDQVIIIRQAEFINILRQLRLHLRIEEKPLCLACFFLYYINMRPVSQIRYLQCEDIR